MPEVDAVLRGGPWTGERKSVNAGVIVLRVPDYPENTAYVYTGSLWGEGGQILESYYDWKRY